MKKIGNAQYKLIYLEHQVVTVVKVGQEDDWGEDQMEKKRRVGPTWKYRLSTHCDRGEGYTHWHTHLRMKCSSVPGNIFHKILTKMFNPRNSMLHLYCSSCQPPLPLYLSGVPLHSSHLSLSSAFI